MEQMHIQASDRFLSAFTSWKVATTYHRGKAFAVSIYGECTNLEGKYIYFFVAIPLRALGWWAAIRLRLEMPLSLQTLNGHCRITYCLHKKAKQETNDVKGTPL